MSTGHGWTATLDLYLTTSGAFNINGLRGDADAIFICALTHTGNNTTCTFRAFWDGDANGFGRERIDGMFLKP